MPPKHQPELLLRFISTAEVPTTIQIDIINGLSGYEFSRLRLKCPLGSTVLWTNRTAVMQIVHLNDQVLRLAPGRSDGATIVSRLTKTGDTVGRLSSNRGASITFTVSDEIQL